MMLNRRVKYVLILSSLLGTFLGTAGCAADTTPPAQEVPQEEREAGESASDEIGDKNVTEGYDLSDVPPLPQTLEELLAYPAGELAGGATIDSQAPDDAVVQVLENLPPLAGDASEEELKQYFAVLFSFFAEEYPDPNDVINKWKTEDFGSPDIDDPRYQPKENYNVEIILDASGSMATVIGNQTMMAMAKEAIREFAEALPAKANVALRVYGHKGSSAAKDKEVSCDSSELIYPLEPFDKAKLNDALDQFEPAGWTPIARSLQEAQKDLSEHDGAHSTNVIYLVSDGEETCGGDPVKAAEELADSNITPIVNIIGFNVDSDGQK